MRKQKKCKMLLLSVKCNECVHTEKKCELMKLIVNFLTINKTMKHLKYKEKRAEQTEKTAAILTD